MSQQKIYKAIVKLHSSCTHKLKKDIVAELKIIAHQTADELQKISNANKKSYKADIELSRLKRKRNNSRQAIRKKWSMRKSYRELIKKHIQILKELKEII